MAVKRELSSKKYLLAFVLTLMIFVGGIIAGIIIENARINDARQINLQEKVNLRSLQLQQAHIDSGIADCKSLHAILENNINELTQKMAVVIDYQKKAIFNEEEFNLQLQDYFLTEIQFYLLSKEIDKKCSQDSVKILYFYDQNEQETQGRILSYLKKMFGSKILVFSLNSGFMQEPMIHILLTSYGIEDFPAVVIDDEVYQGHRNVKQLMTDLCRKFEEIDMEMPEECRVVQKSGS